MCLKTAGGLIGMANYEKQVEQEAAYPIAYPIPIYCYRTVRYEKRYHSGVYSYASLLMPHCPVTVVQRYRDRVCNALFHLFFIIRHLYIPLHLDFLYLFYRFLAVPNAPSKHIKENCIYMQNISITAHMHYRDTER